MTLNSLAVKINEWIECTENLENNFLKKGYCVSEIYVSQVEAMRNRTALEKDVRFYIRESIKETVYLRERNAEEGRWSPKNRKVLLDAQRSEYLDILQKLYDEGEYDFLEKYKASIEVHLDPNLILYGRWKLFDQMIPNLVWLQHLGRITKQKVDESVMFGNRSEHFLPNQGKVEVKELLQLIQMVAEEFSFNIAVVAQGENPRIIVECPLQNDLSIYLEWKDSYLFRRQGSLDFRLVIREQKAKIWNRSEKFPFFCCYLEHFIPGAGSYLETQNEKELISLAVFAHMDFMKLASQI